VLVRRRIQTPSDVKVLSVVQPEEEVVLGASPPARPFVVGNPARFARHDDFRRLAQEASGFQPTPAKPASARDSFI
jgi:hypothetical protein